MKDLHSSVENPLIKKIVFRKTARNKCGRRTSFFGGLILLVLSATSLIWTPFHTMLNERLRMRPGFFNAVAKLLFEMFFLGFPGYEWWKTPPDQVLLRVYIFNVTNAEEFLNGTHDKLKVQEIGPIIFREHLTHSNVTFNANDTLSYVAKRSAIYLPDMNTIDLNSTLVVPNLPILGMASYLWDSSFVTKIGFSLLLRTLESRSIIHTSIYNYLWNFTDSILDVAQTLAPTLVPLSNMGILHIMYSNFENLVTVKIGTTYGSQNFFLIDKFDGSDYFPNFDNACKSKLVNATEGVAYPQFLTKETTLHYWRQTICKVVDLNYKREVYVNGVKAYLYLLNSTIFNRVGRIHDCHSGNPPLPNGLSDVSKCYFNFPMASSFPHFLHADNSNFYVDGLEPDVDKHSSYVVIEPITGVPIESRARLQSNLVVKELDGFNDIVERFSNTIIPMFWAEYNQVGLPLYITALVYFTVNVVPYLQFVVILMMIISGISLTIYSTLKYRRTVLNSEHSEQSGNCDEPGKCAAT
ncbi:hypothetical protein RN001_010633 [Aquatica leii]|uniref:Scavenger receptor class B member 1 n=1 Tax=Aquatica leii TaxID=1421715 RepID=A0AAN7P6U9_9COLE|nr:hypothetical protein RN001_010633 [Aquatica leii]